MKRLVLIILLLHIGNIVYGQLKDSSLFDERDSQTYSIINVNGTWWMNENLSYHSPSSYCYQQNDSFCDKYGRLYSWSISQSVCPTGWELPTKEDWNNIVMLVSDSSLSWNLTLSGSWVNKDSIDSNFNLLMFLPAGRKVNRKYFFLGEFTSFWFASEGRHPLHLHVGNDVPHIHSHAGVRKSHHFSVRCVKKD